VKFNGREIRDFSELRRRVSQAKVGEDLPVEVLRDGKKVSLKVRLVEEPRAGRAALPAPPQGGLVPQPAPTQPQGAAGANALSGLAVSGITPALVSRFNLPENIQGVLVDSVAPGSPAEGILQPGDAIEQVNDAAVASAADFETAVEALAPGERVIVLLSRGRVRSFAVVGP
jgi:serine protease Do